MTWHHITSHHMTWHVATNHITSSHVTSQPTTLLHLSPQPTSWHYNTSHHHHGTVEGSLTPKTRFGHRRASSPCPHSIIGKVFLWSIAYSSFPFWNFHPRLARLYLHRIFFWSFCFILLQFWVVWDASGGTRHTCFASFCLVLCSSTSANTSRASATHVFVCLCVHVWVCVCVCAWVWTKLIGRDLDLDPVWI